MKVLDIITEMAASLPGATSGIKIMSPEEFVKSQNADDDVEEATVLPAPHRKLTGKELPDYLDRIRGVPDIDKKTGQVKKQPDKVSKKGVVKPGKEKVISLKTKDDKYKMPYIHRESVMRYYSPEGNVYDTEKMKAEIKKRPATLLKQNEKMKHSNGALEQFFNIGFAALVGVAVDESTDDIIIVNTCPGAGACMVDCYEMKGGFIQYEDGWLSRSKVLNFLLNDPDGFKSKLNAEIQQEESEGKSGNYSVSVRWHNSGDFFSPEYMNLAFDIARAHPDVRFYAYTKMAGAALAQKPNNFIINWSEGAHPSQAKQIKAQDSALAHTKNSRIVPEELFADLLLKDEHRRLIKKGRTYKTDAEGNPVLDKAGRPTIDIEGTSWQLQPGMLATLKQRLAEKYKLSAHSILSYDEYMAKRGNIPAGMKYNVIVAPGEGDVSANDHNVLSTLLLRH